MRSCLGIFVLALLTLAGVAVAQEPVAPAPAAAPASGGFRKLAPWVETTIRADIRAEEMFSFEKVADQTDVRIKHDVQALELTFKPLRMLTLDMPAPGGTTVKKTIWYLIYHVRQPQRKNFEDGSPIETPPMRFYPVFWLEDQASKRVYPDQLLTTAIPVIQRREDPRRKLLNTVEISGEIPSSQGPEDQSVWGVVTWQDIDLNINRFSIFVRGLSTAYRLGTEPGVEGKMQLKTLQLNFWRPADAFLSHEAEIRFGAPGDVDYRWLYR